MVDVPPYVKPEERARRLIDARLTAAGWIVRDRRHLNLDAAPGVALFCETDVDGGFADYMLSVDGKAIGVLESKAAGTSLVSVSEESELYARAALRDFQRWTDPLPFTHESNGEETRFRNLRDPRSRSRFAFGVHRPETLREWVQEPATLRARLTTFPALVTRDLRECQIDAIIVDECHRSIYNLWRGVLDYFDAFQIGLTATPTAHTLGYFNQNLVYSDPQIRTVLTHFRDALFTRMFPHRTGNWIPKTLIYAKDDAHADRIVDITATCATMPPSSSCSCWPTWRA